MTPMICAHPSAANHDFYFSDDQLLPDLAAALTLTLRVRRTSLIIFTLALCRECQGQARAWIQMRRSGLQ